MTARAMIGASFALLLALPPLGAAASTVYDFTSFSGPGMNGGGTTVNGISNSGSVVGFSSNNAAIPTLLTNFIRSPTGAEMVLNINNDPLAMANGVSASGTIVGGTNGSAFTLSKGGALTILAPVNGTVASQTAFGVNSSGTVVGQFTDNATGTTPGFLFKGGSGYTILSPVPNALVTNAQGVNDAGLATGFYSLDGVHQHGFFYDSATLQYTLAADPVVANLVLTQFFGLNDKGVSVGYYQTLDGSQHGFLYNLSTKNFTFLDEPNAAKSGVSITQVTGINDSGEIAGFYVDAATGAQLGFVATTVPEPATWAMALLGFAALGFFRPRRRASLPRRVS